MLRECHSRAFPSLTCPGVPQVTPLLKPVDKCWQPADFLPASEDPDFTGKVCLLPHMHLDHGPHRSSPDAHHVRSMHRPINYVPVVVITGLDSRYFVTAALLTPPALAPQCCCSHMQRQCDLMVNCHVLMFDQ
jgi:hypothetical protein